jgi:Zn-finger nucleic acid-binding protein
MECPVCNIDSNMMDRQGVEIDYCPECRRVWLDRGELDTSIECSGSPQSHSRPEQYDHDHHDDYFKQGEHHGPKDRSGQASWRECWTLTREGPWRTDLSVPKRLAARTRHSP